MGLPYNEPDRGGIETEQSMIHLGVLGRLKKKNQVVLRSNMSSQNNKASLREVDLVDTQRLTASLQMPEKNMLVNLAFRRVPERGR